MRSLSPTRMRPPLDEPDERDQREGVAWRRRRRTLALLEPPHAPYQRKAFASAGTRLTCASAQKSSLATRAGIALTGRRPPPLGVGDTCFRRVGIRSQRPRGNRMGMLTTQVETALEGLEDAASWQSAAKKLRVSVVSLARKIEDLEQRVTILEEEPPNAE